MTNTPQRNRQRAVTVSAQVEIDPQLKVLAKDYFIQNKQANSCKGVADKARKALYKGMKDKGLTSFEFVTDIDGATTTILVSVKQPEGTAMDAEKLLTTVFPSVADAVKKLPEGERKTFYSLFKVGKGDVEAHCGKNVATQISVASIGTENAYVELK